ncbi:hypothetical protein HPP92_013893 [Vanilla planifolia]|uniref:Uncharacterized protein n=1 Tax=Vanilla planifolia TaxID=51239 RepID=A0A835UWX2_VANPL|nr:hypothetical protein HPP92_013893 [Vanilla planifolia]
MPTRCSVPATIVFPTTFLTDFSSGNFVTTVTSFRRQPSSDANWIRNAPGSADGVSLRSPAAKEWIHGHKVFVWIRHRVQPFLNPRMGIHRPHRSELLLQRRRVGADFRFGTFFRHHPFTTGCLFEANVRLGIVYKDGLLYLLVVAIR